MRSLTPLEVYGIAIRSEISARDFYERLKNRLKEGMEPLKEKLEFLKGEEEKHLRLLTSLYQKAFPKTPLRLPKKDIAPLPKIPLKGKISLSHLLEKAMAAELASEEFYESAKEKSEEENTRKVFSYLASMEKGHYFLLKAEYDLLTTFADYDSFKKFSLEHLGP